MASFTITTTAAEDAGIAFALAQFNAERAARGQGPVTAGQYVQARLHDVLQGWASQQNAADPVTLAQAFQQADPTVKAQVKGLLGVT